LSQDPISLQRCFPLLAELLPEEKQMPEYLSILPRSDCRETGASGGNQMKTITIRLPDVEAAMLVEVQKVNRAYRDLQGLLINQIQQEYAKTPKGRAAR
jgi:hypothetical protein